MFGSSVDSVQSRVGRCRRRSWSRRGPAGHRL